MQDVLISFRTSSEVIDRIKAFLMEHQIWNKNKVIHMLLEKIFKYVSDDDLYTLFTTKEVESVEIIVHTKDLGVIK